MKKITIILTALLALSMQAGAQSKLFKLGQAVEVHTAILQELNRSYVDSLPVERMNTAGINAMLETLDPYTIYVPEEENENFEMMIGKTYGGIGAIIYKPSKDMPVMINEPYANSPAAKAGLQCGDEILEIDGVSTIGLTAAESSDKMKGKPATQVYFHVRKVRSGEIKDITITREKIHIPDIEYAALLDGTKTGYIRIGGFTEGLGADFRSRVKELRKQGMDKLVIDLRGNGGGMMNEAVNIVSAFVPKGSLVVSSKGNSLVGEQQFKTSLEPVDLELPVVVMVDSGSASASEIVSGALQDLDRATIMGTRTFGKGLVQSIRPLPYNGQLKVTSAKYYTPSGRCVQAIDYSHRNEDGSVGHVPDSLISKFYTKNKREVYDGGGITPDVVVDDSISNTLLTQLMLKDMFFKYSVWYRSKHESIGDDPAKFVFSDVDYKDFKDFLVREKFEYKSFSEESVEDLIEVAKTEKYYDNISKDIETLLSKLKQDKDRDLERYRDEVTRWIVSYIMPRYFYEKGSIMFSINYDEEVKEAIKILKDEKRYNEILSPKK